MATDIVQSLFGMTPDSYQQAQQDRANTQAMQFAKLDPFQQANYSIGRGAYGLAGAVGGALGGQDPELQRHTMRQKIANQIDNASAEGLMSGAKLFSQANDPEMAHLYALASRKFTAEEAKNKLTSAQAEYYGLGGRGTKSGGTDQLSKDVTRVRLAIATEGNRNNWSAEMIEQQQDIAEEQVRSVWARTAGKPAGSPAAPAAGQTPAAPVVAAAAPTQKLTSNEFFTKGELSPGPDGSKIDITGPLTKEMKQSMVDDALERGDLVAAKTLIALPIGTRLTRAQGTGQIEAAKQGERIVETTKDGKAVLDTAKSSIGETPPQFNPTVKAAVAGATAQGTAVGTAAGTAQVSIQGAETNAKDAKNAVAELLNHPGFKSTVGFTLLPGARFVHGTDEAGFMSRLDQIKGGAFLEAYVMLKGGGAITEIEGTNATNAINRMSIASNEKEFRQAGADFVAAVESGVAKLKSKAAMGLNPTTPPTSPNERTVTREVKLKDGRIGVEYSDGTRGFK